MKIKFPFKIRVSISFQILIFLLIIAFVPVAGVMALKTYEKQLLEQIENSSVQQGRLVSSALNGKNFQKEKAVELLVAMNGRFDARIRILDSSLNLIADSAVLNGNENNENEEILPLSNSNAESRTENIRAEETLVYRILSKPVRIYRQYFKPPVQNSADYYSKHTIFDGKEVKAALEGKYGAATRISQGGQNSINLYSAVPVFDGDKVCGVVLVSRSTYKILKNLYELRLDLGRVFLWSLLFVAVIAFFLSFRISYPLKKLSRQTVKCADRQGRVISTDFEGMSRGDEIGELSRAFSSLVERLKNRIRFTESFASDVSHEFKNPLAAIRSCTEMLTSDISENDKKSFVNAINEEIMRLEKLLTGVRNITKIDGEADIEKISLCPNEICENLINQEKLIYPEIEFNYEYTGENPADKILIGENYLERIIDNLLSNAAGFGKRVLLRLKTDKKILLLTVEDNGCGIPEAEIEKIFNRFYTNRSENEKTAHTGLGLATVKAIVQAMNGKIAVSKSHELGGAAFEIQIPLNQDSSM